MVDVVKVSNDVIDGRGRGVVGRGGLCGVRMVGVEKVDAKINFGSDPNLLCPL